MRIKLDIPLTLEKIKVFSGIKSEKSDKEIFINYISTDTRELFKKDLFIALKGEKYDAESFLPIAKEIGAYIMSTSPEYADILVSDTKSALMGLASLYMKQLPLKEVVAITGSVGKTTTRELLYHIIKSFYVTHSTDGNLNNEIGVPFTILSAPKNTEILLIEAGMNSLGELKRISNAISPTLTIITNIGTSHIGNLGSREMIAKAKLEIICGMKIPRVIIPSDEKLLNSIEGSMTVSISNNYADFCLSIVQESNIGGVYNFKTDKFYIPSIGVQVVGKHISYCLAFALSAASVIGLDKKRLSEGISNIPPKLSRVNFYRLGKINILEDSYNSSYESIKLALETLKLFKASAYSVLIGDINELGIYTEEIHTKVGKLLAESNIKNLYTFGVYSEFIANGARIGGMNPENIFKNTDILNPEKVAQLIYKNTEKDEAILVKASHAVNITGITDILKQMIE